MRFSFFDGFYSNRPHLSEASSWEEFCETMRAISEVPGYKPEATDYERTQGLISAAIYGNDGDKRGNANVIGWDMLILDIDDTNKTLEEIDEIFKHFHRIFYSSASCTRDKLKLRVIIPFDETAPKEHLKAIWYAAQMWCDGLIDEQTKDMSRLNYIPARYTNKGDDYRHFFIVKTGDYLNWRNLMARYPMPPEEERFKRNNPLRNLKRKIFTDNNPLPDLDINSGNCPFVTEQMKKDYLLTPAGSHHSAIYKFMVQICYRARDKNYPLTEEELADMGKQMDDLDGGFYDMKKMRNNAVDAMSFVGM